MKIDFLKILIMYHGGAIHDTICSKERKTFSSIDRW